MAGRISYTGGIVRNGLVLHLDAAKRDSYPKTGTVWSDLSGNGNNGTLTNGPTYNSNNGGSIQFDGVDDYVIRTSNYLIAPTQVNFSIESIIYMTQNPTDTGFLIPGLITLDGGVGTINYMSFGPLPSRQLKLRWFDGTQNGKTGNTILNLNQWYNIVCTVTNSTILFYINGTVETTYTGNNLTNRNGNNGQYSIGSNYYGKYFGYVPSIKVYDRALSAAEVLQNYNALKGRYI